jgi:uncharacterized membrane protein YhaH (DUF805 family)
MQFLLCLLLLFCSFKINASLTYNLSVQMLYLPLKFISGVTLISSLIMLPLLIIRRLHDINFSGAYLLACLIPLLGFLFFAFISPSDKGVNKYGPEVYTYNIIFKFISILILSGLLMFLHNFKISKIKIN